MICRVVKKSSQFHPVGNFWLLNNLLSYYYPFSKKRMRFFSIDVIYLQNISLHCAHFCPIRINLHGKIKREITWFIQKGSANLNTTKFQTHIPLRHCRSQLYTMGLNSFWRIAQTYVFFDCEFVNSVHNGMRYLLK